MLNLFQHLIKSIGYDTVSFDTGNGPKDLKAINVVMD